MTAYLPVTLRSDWGYYDALDGADLREGDRVSLLWPDSSRTTGTIRVSDTITNSSPRDGDIHDCKAFVEVEHRGAKARVYLRGGQVKLKRA